MKNIIIFACVAIVASCLLCFSVAVFGGPILLAYQLVTIAQLLTTVALCMVIGGVAALIISKGYDD